MVGCYFVVAGGVLVVDFVGEGVVDLPVDLAL